MTHLVGREVAIFPGDTYKKQGIILEVYEHGILFEITSYTGSDNVYIVGKQHYLAFSARLTFRVI